LIWVSRLRQARGNSFTVTLIERVSGNTRVKSAAVTSFIPLSLNYNSNSDFLEGQPSERGDNVPTAMTANAGTRYFETMATPILREEKFTDQDNQKNEAVAVVNETFVKRLMPVASSNRCHWPSSLVSRASMVLSSASSELPGTVSIGISLRTKTFRLDRA
jgi:hypothetical protein